MEPWWDDLRTGDHLLWRDWLWEDDRRAERRHHLLRRHRGIQPDHVHPLARQQEATDIGGLVQDRQYGPACGERKLYLLLHPRGTPRIGRDDQEKNIARLQLALERLHPDGATRQT